MGRAERLTIPVASGPYTATLEVDNGDELGASFLFLLDAVKENILKQASD